MKQIGVICSLILQSYFVHAQFQVPAIPLGKLVLRYYEPEPGYNDLTKIPDSRCQNYINQVSKLYSKIKLLHKTKPEYNISRNIEIFTIVDDQPWLRKNGLQYNFFVEYSDKLKETTLWVNIGRIGVPIGTNIMIFEYDHLTGKGYLTYVYGKFGQEGRIRTEVNKMFKDFETILFDLQSLAK